MLMSNEKISSGIKGGKREGAGRKAGIPNKRTAAVQKAVEESGLTPLQYLLSVMRDELNELKERKDAAIAAAPYVHPKLSSIEFQGEMSIKRPQELTDNELASIAASSR